MGKTGHVVLTHNPRAGEVEARGSLGVTGQHTLIGELQASERAFLTK